MLSRISVASAMALLGLIAATGITYAADNSDREEVIFGTAAVALGLAVLIGIAYVVKRAMGLDKMAPPEPDEGHGGHH